MSLSPIPVLTAPTASGKSALALELAQEFRLEIVSADAFTVYRAWTSALPSPVRRSVPWCHTTCLMSWT
ncbi:hypothetical protein [Deinococcus radiophilus]|uniref:hypothetical protein n=1 Tax=Deinococcus radiophilus TaxID=32062 RepID=UPI00360ABB2D